MKVAYLLGSLNRGGTETMILDIFNHAGQVPFKLMGVYRKDGDLSKYVHLSEMKVFKLESGHILILWLYLWRLRQLIKNQKVDIVHAHQNLDLVYARLACLGLSLKVIQTIHGYDFNSSRFNKLLIRLSLKMADLNIFVSESQRKYYASLYKLNQQEKQTVLYNGINFERLKNVVETSIRIELGISEKSFLMGMVGNFVHVRDQMTICRFLELLHKKDHDFIFLFIGKKEESNPQLYDECRLYCENNGLKDKVLFLGSRSDVPNLLSQLDAFLYSTDHDTFGIAVIEAIAAGIPTFVNDWEVMKEITENGKRATLYRTKDENDLFDKFLSFLQQPETFIKAAIKNAVWARETYSIQKHLARLYDVYSGIT